jgi:anaerobic selenocysteine-containing dehydrogenase
MRDISRRTFLKSSSAALVAAGTISALPAAPAVLNALESQGPADTGAAESGTAEVATASESVGAPLIAHVQETGEIAIYAGTREMTLVDPQLAARLARAIG